MKQIITDFNALLKRTNSVAIVCLEDRTEWTIGPKDNADEFISAIEAVTNDGYDSSSEIRTAEAFDSGYSLEIGLRLRDADNDTSATIYLYHANKI